MKTTNFILVILLLGMFFSGHAQQTSELNPNFIKVPVFADLTAITTVNPSPQQGFLVFNANTQSNWYYNGTIWVNLAGSDTSEPEGYGAWGCDMNALESFNPVGDMSGMFEDGFGLAVDISGNIAVVGSPQDDENGFENTGSMSIFEWNPETDTWDFVSKKFNTVISLNSNCGASVAVSGEYAVMGCPEENSGTGSAIVFKKGNSGWQFHQKLYNGSPATDDYFGGDVAIDNDFLVITAPRDDEFSITNRGSFTVFKRNSSTTEWESQGKISNASIEGLGYSCDIQGDLTVIGSPYDINFTSLQTGSASVYKRNTGTGAWELQTTFISSAGQNNDLFGLSVSTDGTNVAVGMSGDDDNSISNCGQVRIYSKNLKTNSWEFISIFNSPKVANQNFGSSVSLRSNLLMVGIPNAIENGINSSGNVNFYAKVGSPWRRIERAYDPGLNAGSFGWVVGLSNNRQFVIGQPFMSDLGNAVFGKVK